MQLSDTPRGQNWLGNFELAERAHAALLLNSVELVGQDALRNGLLDLLATLASELSTPIALVPVRELAPGQSYYKRGRDAGVKLLQSGSFPGSEALVASIITGAKRVTGKPGPFVEAPTLKNMRLAQCRSVLFIDDFAGSGGRIHSFYKGYKAHRSLASWHSYGRIDYHVACFAATQQAFRRLERTFGLGHIHVHRMCPTIGDRGWEEGERNGVSKLCRRYLSTAIAASPMGYGDIGALLAFSHSAPNNLPVILWQKFRAGHPGWEPFFLDKGVPDDVRAMFEMSHEERSRKSAFRRLRQGKLAGVDWNQLASAEAQNMMLVLAAIARRPRDRHHVAQLTGLSVPAVQRAFAMCAGLELVAQGLHLTDRGRAELSHAKSVTLPVDTLALKESYEPDYPTELRARR